MTAPPPERPDSRDRPNLIAGAVVLILLLGVVALGIWLLSGGPGRGAGVIRTVYLPGVPQLGATAEVLFHGEHVGEVVGTDPPRVGLQLVATAGVVPEVTEVVTLFPGESVRLTLPSDTAQVSIGLASLTQAEIRAAPGAWRLRREETNRWRVDDSQSREPLTVNGRTAGDRRGTRWVEAGDVLSFGRVRVEWADISDLSRLSVRFGMKRLRRVAGVPDTTTPRYLLGPRSSLTVVNAFGLGKPALRLEPGFGRAAFAMGPDSVIAPAPGLDLERTVQGMLSYLNSPAALRREPATRFERVVSELDLSLERVAQVGKQLDSTLALVNAVGSEQGGRGMVGRLVFTPGTLDSIRATAARLATATAPLADTSRSFFGRLKLDTLEAGVTRAASSADRMLTRIDSVAAKAGGLLDTLRPAIVTARDSLPRLIGNANGLTTEGAVAARGVKRWLPPFLIGGTGAALAAILKLIGVF